MKPEFFEVSPIWQKTVIAIQTETILQFHIGSRTLEVGVEFTGKGLDMLTARKLIRGSNGPPNPTNGISKAEEGILALEYLKTPLLILFSKGSW